MKCKLILNIDAVQLFPGVFKPIEQGLLFYVQDIVPNALRKLQRRFADELPGYFSTIRAPGRDRIR